MYIEFVKYETKKNEIVICLKWKFNETTTKNPWGIEVDFNVKYVNNNVFGNVCNILDVLSLICSRRKKQSYATSETKWSHLTFQFTSEITLVPVLLNLRLFY